VTVSSNSERVVDLARAEWGAWKQLFEASPLFLRYEISGTSAARPPQTQFHADQHLFSFTADAQNFSVGDLNARRGTAWLSPGAIGDAAYFSYHFLESLALLMLTSLHFTPFHASCVAREGRGVLLCGDSGAGKSSLAYACARRGWTYLSDDSSYLLRRAADPTAVGHSHRIRFLADAPNLFPELAGYPTILRANAKTGFDLRTESLGIKTAPCARVDRIIVLHRGGARGLAPMEKSALLQICEPMFHWWTPPIAAEQRASFERIVAASSLLALEYSDLDSAVDLLES